MEFTLGFSGGLAMAYAVSTTKWPAAAKPSRVTNWIALLFITWLLPWSNYVNAFEGEKLMRLAEGLGIKDRFQFVSSQQTLGLAMLVLVGIAASINWLWHEQRDDKSLLRLGSFVLFAYTLYYVIYGFIVKGFFYRYISIENSDTMYLPILFAAAIIWLWTGRGRVAAETGQNERFLGIGFAVLGAMVVTAIIAVTAATQTIHDGKISFHERFPTQEESHK